jgi:hypothetical protein
MYYLLYLDKMFRAYIIIRYMHGTYVSYYFLKWMMGGVYSSIVWTYMKIFEPKKQIDDIYFNIIEKDDLLIVYKDI